MHTKWSRGGGRGAHVAAVAVMVCCAVHDAGAGAVAAAAQPEFRDQDLRPEVIRDLPLEALMQIDVTTVAGVGHEWFRTPSALTVITSEDIRRTGHRSLGEALRIVPGMFVGRSGSHSWRIGPRGFSGGLAPRNLVLIDGRSVYDPLHGGVFWDVQDIIFEDLDRIEVIRGPGATLWGANAVNGVVNVITRSAHDTQGVFLRGSGGTFERGFAAVRYGGTIDDATAFRIYGKYFNRDRFDHGTQQAHDDWSMLRGGFRLDHLIDTDTTLTFITGGYGSLTMGEFAGLPPMAQDQRVSGAHALARLAHNTIDAAGHRAGWSIQTYYDRTNRDQATIDVRRDTFDIEFRHHFGWGEAPHMHEFIWGVGNRYSHDRVDPGPTLIVNPRSRALNTVSGFVQNTFALVPNQAFFMAGTKLEHNTFTGFEVQPSGRLWWTPDERNMLWGAISRPVRIPSRFENDIALGTVLPPPVGLFPLILPGRDLKAERLLAYELGYRVRPTGDLTLDSTFFYHDYHRIIGFDPDVFALQPAPWTNEGRGESYGIELAADWRAADNWRLGGGYAFVMSHVRGVFDLESGDNPEHLAFLRSHFDILPALELNPVLYYVDNLTRVNVPSYFRLDVGVTWHVSPNFEIAAWGQNLLHPSHPETTRAREFPRGFYVQGTIRY
jgi:iron complex outermembrane recepter protein